MLTFDELTYGVRKRLKIKASELSDDQMKAVWVALDDDESGYIDSTEFHTFMGIEEDTTLTAEVREELLKKKNTKKREEQAAGTSKLDGFITEKTSDEMKEELESSGLKIPEGEELTAMAVQFAKWVKAYKPGTHQGIAWLEIFKEVDEDHSGLLSYDELRMVIRRMFKVKAAQFSDQKIKQMWCALDTDGSDSVAQVEFARFVKRANAGTVKDMGNHPLLDKQKFSMKNTLLSRRQGGLDDEEEAKRVRDLFNAKLDDVVQTAKADGWLQLFKEFDNDVSGLITYDELERGVRVQLQITSSELSVMTLRSLWISLDEDDSGYIESAEFIRFMDREEPATAEDRRRDLIRQSSKQKRAMLDKAKAQHILDEKLVSSIPTQDMRKQLEEASFAVPEGEELKKLANQFANWTKILLPDVHQNIAWLKVFKMVDDDDSGLLTYDELRHVVRRLFKVKKAVWSEEQIMALWCALDKDNSNSIARVEFGRMMKLADKDDNYGKTRFTFTNRLEASRKGGLSAQNQQVVSDLLNKKIDEKMPGDSKGWFALFKNLDTDASGLLEYEEVEVGIRQELNVSKEELSDAKLKALWITLDEDDSGTVESAEFHRFMQREEPKTAFDKRQELMRASSKKKRAMMDAAKEAERRAEGFVSSMRTKDMKAKLKELGLSDDPDDDMVREYAVLFAKWTKSFLPDAHQGIAWLKAFKEVDDVGDGAGVITYDEVRLVIRRKFKVPNSQFSEEKIMQMWIALDHKFEDCIPMARFASFMKVATGVLSSIKVVLKDDKASRLARGASSARNMDEATKPVDTRTGIALAKAYGDDLRALLSPRKPSRRSPVIKLGSTIADYNVPGPGSYNPTLINKTRPSAWVMGDRNARKSSVQASGDSPGPAYMLKGSVSDQVTSGNRSAAYFGFGTERRKLGGDGATDSPGPGAYNPRVTKNAAPSAFMTVATGQLTEATTPRHSANMVNGVWSRNAGRELEKVIPGPGPENYSPRIDSSRPTMPHYSMRAMGTRQMADPGGELSPGPLGYAPKTGRRGGGQLGDSPRYTMAKKDDAANSRRYYSSVHSRIYQGREGAPSSAYTPLEQFGVTSLTISNTSKHAPLYSFGSEVRPCAP